jgi:hypothetical protein
VEAERKMRLHISNARQYVEEQMREAAARPEVAPPTAKKAAASKATASWGGRRSRATLQPRR